jgi:hypothetical protein
MEAYLERAKKEYKIQSLERRERSAGSLHVARRIKAGGKRSERFLVKGCPQEVDCSRSEAELKSSIITMGCWKK